MISSEFLFRGGIVESAPVGCRLSSDEGSGQVDRLRLPTMRVSVRSVHRIGSVRPFLYVSYW